MEFCPDGQTEVISDITKGDFSANSQNSGNPEIASETLYGTAETFSITTNDVLVYSLNTTKWGNASFDLIDICLETTGIESFRIIANDGEGNNVFRTTVC